MIIIAAVPVWSFPAAFAAAAVGDLGATCGCGRGCSLGLRPGLGCGRRLLTLAILQLPLLQLPLLLLPLQVLRLLLPLALL